MLLGSAALGFLAVGDAPYPFAPVRPPPPPPPTARVPSGHNIFVTPSPISPPTTVFFGVLPDVPAQVAEPGVTLYFNVGLPPALTAPVTLTFTKPSGAAYTTDPSLLYIGETQVASARGSFLPGTYLVYTFAGGELDELGRWTVVAQLGAVTSPPGTFTVVRNVGI